MGDRPPILARFIMARIKKDERQQILGQTRLRLLDAAVKEFARVGFSEANINTISTSAGFAKGTIYNYFSSKRALLIALIDATAIQHYDFIVEQVRVEPNPARRLAIFYKAGFEYITHHLSRARVLINTINGPDEAFKAYLFKSYQPMFQFVAEEIIMLGLQQDIFRPVEPGSMARLLMTIYLGAASQLDPQGRLWMDPDQVARLVLDGLNK
jgi:AcrR family transcriptional regulator